MSTGASIIPRGIAGLYVTGEYSDCKVICGKDIYNLHQAIICSQSAFFKAAFRGNTKEAITSTVQLPEDDPAAVKRMMQYFYHGDYSVDYVKKCATESDEETTTEEASEDAYDPYNASCWGNCDTTSPGTAWGDPTEREDALTQHIHVYITADKYDVPLLKELAHIKFRNGMSSAWDGCEFMNAVEEVYVRLPFAAQDKALKDCILHVIGYRRKLIRRKRVLQVIRNTELGMDIVLFFADEKLRCPHLQSWL